MPAATKIETLGLILATFVGVTALLLIVYQWRERTKRPETESAADLRYFVRQDFRRGLGSFLMLVLAIGLGVGSSTPYLIQNAPNFAFVRIWFGVILLALLLLVMALLDWIANHCYARRQRRALVQERIDLIREHFSRAQTPFRPSEDTPKPNGRPS